MFDKSKTVTTTGLTSFMRQHRRTNLQNALPHNDATPYQNITRRIEVDCLTAVLTVHVGPFNCGVDNQDDGSPVHFDAQTTITERNPSRTQKIGLFDFLFARCWFSNTCSCCISQQPVSRIYRIASFAKKYFLP
jgi:hypothetical protein